MHALQNESAGELSPHTAHVFGTDTAGMHWEETVSSTLRSLSGR